MREHTTVRIMLNSQRLTIANPALVIKKSAGQHTRVTLRGTVPAESYQMIAGVDSMTEIQIGLDDITDYLFCGLVTYLDVQTQTSEGIQYQEIYLEAMSHTCLLDQTRVKRAFQKKSASFRELLDIVLSDYPESKYLFGAQLAEKPMNRFAVQYEETDWEFLARLASLEQMPLIACHNASGIHFTLGAVWGEQPYSIPQSEENQAETIYDGGCCLRWRGEDPGTPVLELGDAVSYRGNTCYVKEAELTVENHVLQQTCLLCGKEGFAVSETENTSLTGLSLAGSVKEVRGNQLKVALDIDVEDGSECWFVYSTFYSTFYCMPERGDRINLYFPDGVEDHAFVLNSVRTSPGEAITKGTKGAEGSAGAGEHRDAGAASAGAGQTKDNVLNIKPYLDRLLSSENQRLINVDVVLREETTEHAQGQSLGDGMLSGTGDALGSAGQRGSRQAEYDFETLASNENVKMLCTKGGQSVILNDETGSIAIVCNDGTCISLAEEGISIETDRVISLDAKNDIRLSAQNAISMRAEETVLMSCQDSFVAITPEEIRMMGTDIRINEE